MAEATPRCVHFEGGGGHVSVTVSLADRKTSVDLATREWDYFVKLFARKIGWGHRLKQ
jgi:hypothetical protein